MESLFCLRYSGSLNFKNNQSFLQEKSQKCCSYRGIMSNALCLEEIHGHRIIIEFGCIMLHAFNVLHSSNGMSLARSWIPIDLTGENVARYFGVPIECSSQETSVSVRVLRLDQTDTEYRRAILFGATFLHIVLV